MLSFVHHYLQWRTCLARGCTAGSPEVLSNFCDSMGKSEPWKHNFWLLNAVSLSQFCSKAFGHHSGENWDYMRGRLAQKAQNCFFCGLAFHYLPIKRAEINGVVHLSTWCWDCIYRVSLSILSNVETTEAQQLQPHANSLCPVTVHVKKPSPAEAFDTAVALDNSDTEVVQEMSLPGSLMNKLPPCT